jgi:hypothetical protein
VFGIEDESITAFVLCWAFHGSDNYSAQ